MIRKLVADNKGYRAGSSNPAALSDRLSEIKLFFLSFDGLVSARKCDENNNSSCEKPVFGKSTSEKMVDQLILIV